MSTFKVLGQFKSESFSADSASLKSFLKNEDLKIQQPTFFKSASYMRMEAMSYSTDVPESPALSQSQLLSLRLDFKYSKGRQDYVIDTVMGHYFESGYNDFGVYDLYGSWNFSQSVAAVGRKREFWNQVDSDWKLGLWQPNWAIDTLRTEEQGLTGVFYKFLTNQFEFLFLATPIFIPTMGPGLREDNGRLEPMNRWTRAPSESFRISDRTRPLVYSIKTPDATELVNNPGAAARMMVGNQQEGFWFATGYARKPINSLILKYDRKLISGESGSKAEAELSPVVGYHELYSADFGYGSDQQAVVASMVTDKPESKKVPDGSIQQSPESISAYGLHLSQSVNPYFLDYPVQLQMGYVKVFGGQIKDFDSDGTEQGAIFDSRVLFRNAIFTKAMFESRIFSRKILSSIKWTRDFEQLGNIFSFESHYFQSRDFSLFAGLDILGPDSLDNKENDSTFINQFRANDRLFAGLSYVF